MAKKFERYNIKKHYDTETIQDQDGNEKDIKRYHTMGTLIAFSDSPIPEDLSFRIELPELNMPYPLAVFKQDANRG